jgi:hypothetical protein
MEEMRNTHKIVVGQPEGETPHGTPRRIWIDDIEINLKGTGYEDME